MSILNLDNGTSRPSGGKKSFRALLGFGLVIAVIGIGSTFASTISINSNQAIEFGQGVQQSIYCGGSHTITVTPISTFANSNTTGTFGLTGITISDIPDECSDRDFVIKVYDNTTTSPLQLARLGEDSMDIANVWWASGCHSETPTCRTNGLDDGYAIVSKSLDDYRAPTGLTPTGDIADSNESFTVTFLAGPISSDSVKKIVIETKDDTFGYEQYCEVSGPCVRVP